MNVQSITWKLSGTVEQQPDKFITVELDTEKLLHMWGTSIVSFEWLKNGQPKPKGNLSPNLREHIEEVETSLNNNKPVVQPLLGIGIFDGIEIGTGRATLCVFAVNKIPTIKCSLLKSMEGEFQKIWNKG